MDTDKIRQDFPVLKKGYVYLDSACMSLKPEQVVNAVCKYYHENPACAGRSSHKLGNAVTAEVASARETVAKFIGAKRPEEIIFTKNTTESINLVAHSLDFKGAVLQTDKEHNSNLLPWLVRGCKHMIVKSRPDGTFDLDAFEGSLDGVGLVSMVHTSNLDGTTIPVDNIIKIAHDHGALVLLDGAQSVPHKPVDVRKLNVDLLAFSGHKMLGPTGVGVLYAKADLLEKMRPFMVGGDTVLNSTYTSYEMMKPPEKFEAGLQNYAGIIGLGAAVEYLKKAGLKNVEKHEDELNGRITDALHGKVDLIGPREGRSGIFSFNVRGANPHEVALFLNNANIMVRSGMHCVHSWFNAHGMKGSVRASLYLYNTKEDCDRFVDAVEKFLKLVK